MCSVFPVSAIGAVGGQWQIHLDQNQMQLLRETLAEQTHATRSPEG
ncbi:hypothetical protein [Streptomyces sp. AcE210]|nr:hypothetical protein [Streptomyces sp. AcE210]